MKRTKWDEAIEGLMKYQKNTNKTRYDDCFRRSAFWVPALAFAYKKVIFSPPATIVIWEDNTKTVVKCSEKDTYDFEKGLALCYMKKALGNKSGKLNKVLHKEIKEVKEDDNTQKR